MIMTMIMRMPVPPTTKNKAIALAVVFACHALVVRTAAQQSPAAVHQAVGNCNGRAAANSRMSLRFIESAEACSVAAQELGLVDTVAHDISEGRSEAQLANQARLPFGCYYMADHGPETQLLFNPNGVRESEDAGRTSICSPRFAVRGVGNCEGMGGIFVPIDSLTLCNVAGYALNLVDTRASDISSGRSEAEIAAQSTRPFGCHFQANRPEPNRLLFNPNGARDSTDTARLAICETRATLAPTPSPTQSPLSGCQLPEVDIDDDLDDYYREPYEDITLDWNYNRRPDFNAACDEQ